MLFCCRAADAAYVRARRSAFALLLPSRRVNDGSAPPLPLAPLANKSRRRLSRHRHPTSPRPAASIPSITPTHAATARQPLLRSPYRDQGSPADGETNVDDSSVTTVPARRRLPEICSSPTSFGSSYVFRHARPTPTAIVYLDTPMPNTTYGRHVGTYLPRSVPFPRTR